MHVPGTRGLLLPIVVSLLGFAAIGVAEDVPTRHSIERNLTSRSVQALHRDGVDGATVSFTGRDGTIRVQSRADADRALTIVRGVNGVRVATVVVPLGSGPAAPVVAPSAVPSVSLTGMPSSAPSTAATPPTNPSAAPSTAATPPTAAPSAPPSGSGTPAAPAPSSGGATLVDVQSQLSTLPKITFRTNSSTLTTRDVSIVRKMAAILQAHPDVRIQIQGDTDSAGPAAYNLALSQARARAVVTALHGDGIAEGRMSVIGLGETNPKVPNTSATNRAINRRVDIVATE